MIEHDGCKGCKYEHETPHSQHCQYCTQNAVDKYTRQTNADRVRNMTDGELADLLVDKMLCDNCFLYDECAQHSFDNCRKTFMLWLQSEEEE